MAAWATVSAVGLAAGVLGASSASAWAAGSGRDAGCPNESLRSENLSLALPDCRAYEPVSPLNAPDEVYLPNSPYTGAEGLFFSNEPFEAATNGDAVTYGADPLAFGGTGLKGNGRGNEFLASRGADGWQTDNIQPSAQGESTSNTQQTVFQAFLFSLSLGIFGATSQPIAGAAQPQAPRCETFTKALYARTADAVKTWTVHAPAARTQSSGWPGLRRRYRTPVPSSVQ